jgi:uncharacterized membrane protein
MVVTAFMILMIVAVVMILTIHTVLRSLHSLHSCGPYIQYNNLLHPVKTVTLGLGWRTAQ